MVIFLLSNRVCIVCANRPSQCHSVLGLPAGSPPPDATPPIRGKRRRSPRSDGDSWPRPLLSNKAHEAGQSVGINATLTALPTCLVNEKIIRCKLYYGHGECLGKDIWDTTIVVCRLL